MEVSGGPLLHLDFASPDAYLTAERALQVLPVACEWVPVLARDLPGATDWTAFRCAAERDIALARIEQLAAARGLQPVRWPDPFPFDSELVLRAATYAKSIGRMVAFTQAAFRQAFAGGHSLENPDTVLIAAAACEMHPAAVLRGVELRSVRAGLARATERAVDLGVRDVPAVWTGDRVFHGDDMLEAAATALAPAVA
jgi:2-hydroxychromene-2-carboxylate isomerase